jgi:diguanylate cyclase (GGDEF)-like protein
MLNTTQASLRTLLLTLLVLLCGGFLATSLVSYYAALKSIRNGIINTELPLTSDNVYSEIQKDLVRPVLISAMMGRDTFLRDWVINGERAPEQLTRYLREVQEQHGTVTSFFVSNQSKTYYQARGVLKTVDEKAERDIWYFRVRDMQAPYEINVDIDMANRDSLTFFVNHKVHDYDGRFIGAAGVGLTVDTLVQLIDNYQARYDRSVYFFDAGGRLTLTGAAGGPLGAKPGQLLSEIAGLEELNAVLPKPVSGNFEYQENGRHHFLNLRFIPELNWFLAVDKHESGALQDIQTSLYLNLLICVLVSAVVVTLVSLVLGRYQRRISTLAVTDQLTGLANRRGFNLLASQALQEARRSNDTLCAMLIDLDHFKKINDSHGHLAGDQALHAFASALQDSLRRSDIVSRWGGEEFALLLKDTSLETASQIAEKIRGLAENLTLSHGTDSLTITISIGLTCLQEDDSLDSLIARADRALYRAKQSGRNRVCLELGAAARAAADHA